MSAVLASGTPTTKASSSATTSLVVTLAQTPTVGNLLVVHAFAAAAASTPTITSLGTNVTIMDTTSFGSTVRAAAASGYFLVTGSPPTTLTVAISTSSKVVVWVEEWTNVNSNSPINGHTMTVMAAAGTKTTAGLVPFVPNTVPIVFAGEIATSTQAISTSDSLTLTTDTNAVSTITSILGYANESATASITASATNSNFVSMVLLNPNIPLVGLAIGKSVTQGDTGGSSSSSVTVTLAQTPQIGNTLVIWTQFGGGGSVPTITSLGSGATILNTSFSGVSGQATASLLVTGTITTLNFTSSVATFWNWYVLELDGAAASSPIDVHAISSTGSTSETTGTVTPAQNNEGIIVFGSNASGSTNVLSTSDSLPFTTASRANSSNASAIITYGISQKTNTTGITATNGTGTSTVVCCAIVTVKPAGSVANTLSLTAGVSVVGLLTKQTNRQIAAASSFSTAISKFTGHQINAGASFTAALKKFITSSKNSGLSFSTRFSPGGHSSISFTAGLSFTGSKKVSITKVLPVVMVTQPQSIRATTLFSNLVTSFTQPHSIPGRMYQVLAAVVSATNSFAFKTAIPQFHAGFSVHGKITKNTILHALSSTTSVSGVNLSTVLNAFVQSATFFPTGVVWNINALVTSATSAFNYVVVAPKAMKVVSPTVSVNRNSTVLNNKIASSITGHNHSITTLIAYVNSLQFTNAFLNKTLVALATTGNVCSTILATTKKSLVVSATTDKNFNIITKLCKDSSSTVAKLGALSISKLARADSATSSRNFSAIVMAHLRVVCATISSSIITENVPTRIAETYMATLITNFSGSANFNLSFVYSANFNPVYSVPAVFTTTTGK